MNSGILFRYFTGSKVTFALIQYFFKAEQLVSNCFDIFIVNFEQIKQCSERFGSIYRKTHALESLFNKVVCFKVKVNVRPQI